ncbi:hypothetical protein DICSQDRAFT_111629 [Dichomitus squalens LYAD-421 SS1]|uniref:Amidohydrolase-related domain-containing protein n=1 Tax=Dichomitus squalens (strain LYAD-421) TaxID=732165 RepID=R7SP86_DICSQ|nr:uncharacterized protein DICSQDRAFT_111629 [Dichomitus squalens LYAD-421 SS1]EJF57550.1 hypothetical protein DICSQDRAFT_111629 [Dichomitus squalens LYAD-421 SS1]
MAHFPGSPDKTRDAILPKLALKPWVQPSPPSLILRNARVIDPARSTLLQGPQQCFIENGLFLSVTPIGVQPGITPKDPPVVSVDLAGKFLCPGLIDCHVHVTAVPGVKSMAELVQTPEQLVHLRSTYVLREMLLRGFTTVRDTGGASRALAEAIAEGLVLGPRLVQCGKALSQTGGHADFGPCGSSSGCCAGHSQSLGRTADGVPQVLKATREELKGGADFIKIMCGGGVASPTDAIESVQFTAEEIQAITRTCKQMGNKHTTAHAYTDASVRHAIDNGVQGIEHGNLISRETAQLMAEKGIFLTPTLSCYGIMVRPPFEDFLSPDGKLKNAQVMSRGLDALKIADEVGVTICYGSDLLTSMHALQTEEFTVRSSVLPAAKVLQHATTNAATMLGDPKLGRITAGNYADLLVLDANPLEDVRVLDRPENHLFAVVQGGHVVSSRVDGLPAESMV